MADNKKTKQELKEEVANLKDVETYDASEGKNPEIHYNANSKKGFPRNIEVNDDNKIALAYEGKKGTDVKTSVDEK